ncbi:MAG: tripartite tricarboxylate transporter permease [archaeon]
MLIELILFLLLGLLAGTITGLIPGIHINLIGALLVSASFSLIYFIPPIYLIVFIVSMAITHTFLDFIPSIFLGCPDTDTELSILPGHKLLKKGQGYVAILLTAHGSLAAIFILIIIIYPAIILINLFYNTIKFLIPYFLIIISILLISLEKKKSKALLVFLLTGFLGFFILNSNTSQPLLPLLTGLFGASNIILSLKNKTKIPKQKIIKLKISLKKPLLGAAIASPLCSFLPGLGSGQVAIIGNTLTKNNNKGFLVLLGATNTLVMGFSFLSLYLIQKTRTGAAVAIKNLVGNPNTNTLILILITIIISGIISFFLTKKLAKIFSKNIHKISYSTISILTLAVLIIIVFLVSGVLGLGVLIISTLTGIFSISQKVRRTNMMGVLLIPTIILYLF